MTGVLCSLRPIGQAPHSVMPHARCGVIQLTSDHKNLLRERLVLTTTDVPLPMTRRWREMDSNPRSPVRSLAQTRSNGEVQHPCAASRMAIGTQIGFAIGGFAPVVAAPVHGEGPNAWVPGAPLHSPIGAVASIPARTPRETQRSEP